MQRCRKWSGPVPKDNKFSFAYMESILALILLKKKKKSRMTAEKVKDIEINQQCNFVVLNFRGLESKFSSENIYPKILGEK